jgi:predicted nucleic acid-binding protein
MTVLLEIVIMIDVIARDPMASRHKKGRPGELRDTMIAAIVRAQHATLATRNTACFDDIPVTLIDPWTA